jgi:hypothetical protein
MAKAHKQSTPVAPDKPIDAPPAPAGGIVFMVQTRAGEWVEVRKPIAASPGKAEPKKRASRQQERVMRAVRKHWPNGVSNDVPIATVWGIVAGELEAESKAQGLAIPSQTTVARALGRRPK